MTRSRHCDDGHGRARRHLLGVEGRARFRAGQVPLRQLLATGANRQPSRSAASPRLIGAGNQPGSTGSRDRAMFRRDPLMCPAFSGQLING